MYHAEQKLKMLKKTINFSMCYKIFADEKSGRL